MRPREWEEIRTALFAGRDEDVEAAEERLRHIWVGYEPADSPHAGDQYSVGPQEEP